MYKSSLTLVLLTIVSFAVPSAANASITFATNLAGSNEVPPNSSPGIGAATVTLLDDLNTLNVTVNFLNLTGPAIMGHIHCCTTPGNNTDIALAFPNFPSASASTFSQTFLLNSPGVLSNGITPSSFITGLEAGNAYVNVHTNLYPEGEIEGFLTATPEPSTAALFAIPAAGLGLLLFRRRLTLDQKVKQ